jgi:hypothetical protein
MHPDNEDVSATARLRSDTDNQTRSAPVWIIWCGRHECHQASFGLRTRSTSRLVHSAVSRVEPSPRTWCGCSRFPPEPPALAPPWRLRGPRLHHRRFGPGATVTLTARAGDAGCIAVEDGDERGPGERVNAQLTTGESCPRSARTRAGYRARCRCSGPRDRQRPTRLARLCVAARAAARRSTVRSPAGDRRGQARDARPARRGLPRRPRGAFYRRPGSTTPRRPGARTGR